MVHEMRLNEKPFYDIKSGAKKIELRLYDEKRKLINLNDTIIFYKRPDEIEQIKAKVIGILRYNTFEELFKDIDYNLSGQAKNVKEILENIHKIYSIDEELKYGIIAIRLELLSLS